MSFARDFLWSKTTWTGIAGIITAVVSAVSGEITWQVAVGGIFALLMQMFRRDATVKAIREEKGG
jgi:hypothetical protein